MKKNLFKLSDLYHVCIWLMMRIGYTLFSIPLLNRLAILQGRYQALTSDERFVIKKNLIATFGETRSEQEIATSVRRYFEFSAKFEMLMRALSLKGFSKSERWPAEGLQHLDEALARGQGVILVSAHFGYARLVEYIIKMKRYNIRVVRSRAEKKNHAAKQQRESVAGLTTFAKFMHDRLQVPVLVAQEQELFAGLNVRPLVKALNQNDILYLLGDGTRATKFIKLDVLRFQLPFPTGYLSVALATGAAVLPVFAVDTREGYGIKIIIEKPLELEKVGPTAEEAAINVEKFARLFESYVERYPHLYKMFAREKGFAKRLARSRAEVADRYIPGKRRLA